MATIEIDEDESIIEALRRDADLEVNPTQIISLVELDDQIKSRRANDTLYRPSPTSTKLPQ
jgi:hypothetical protein